jgi:hypothetical protein
MYNLVKFAKTSTALDSQHTRLTATVAVVIAVAGLLLVSACAGGTSSPTGPSGASISVPDPTSATSLTYTANIAPILQSDCTTCHNTSTRSGGYDLSSYAGVMRAVTAGNAQSALVRATQPGGVMYSMLRTTAAEKSATIKRWVVDFKAAQ